MAILQAYQADVLKEMDEGAGLTPEAVKELRRATDLALRATKHTARAVGCSMAGSVAAERHLWLNLTEICEKEKVFLLDAPISQSGLFGEGVSSVVEKFRSAKTQSAALKQFMPRRMRDHSTPSSSLSREQSLPRKKPSGRSCAPAHPPPTTVWGARGQPFPHQRPRRRVDLKRPVRPAASAPPSLPDPQVGMRRAFSSLRDETRPLNRICPPPTRSPHSDLSYPPLRFRCAERVHQHHSSSVWQLGDASGLPPLPSIPLPPADHVIGDTIVYLLQRTGPAPATFQSSALLSIIPNKDARGFPSWWRTSPLPDLLDTSSQVCLPQHDTLLPLSRFFHEWERLPGVSLWVLCTVRWPSTHFSLGEIPPASTEFS